MLSAGGLWLVAESVLQSDRLRTGPWPNTRRHRLRWDTSYVTLRHRVTTTPHNYYMM